MEERGGVPREGGRGVNSTHGKKGTHKSQKKEGQCSVYLLS